MNDKIIKIACDLFLRYGIRSVTMDEIAAEAGISKRTLYEKFSNKEDLLEKLLENIWVEHRSSINQIIMATPSCLISILNIMKYVTKDFKDEQIIKSREGFFNDLNKFYPNVAKKNKDCLELLRSFMAEHLKKGVEQQTVRKNLNLDLISTLLIVQIEGLDNIKAMQQFHPREIFTTAIISFCRGISTENGLKEIEDFLTENEVYI
ncbi:MAG: TetR/AcrR family transcriptional regulator [Prevotellaceae bacterium]|jgi:AcrR family transcriptional regulator|nr:TetR/AcrR family transcriptional regulator [Prevotellaceae bacterium]